jgi:hypothetical protein
LQYGPVLSQLAVLNPEKINHHLRCIRPSADAAVDGDEVAFSDGQAGLVVDVLRQVGDQRLERVPTLGDARIVLNVVVSI